MLVIQTLCRAPAATTTCTRDQAPTGTLLGQGQEVRDSQPPTAVHSEGMEGTIKCLGNGPIVKQEVEDSTAQLWEAQWQEFLNTVEVSPSMPEVIQFPQEPVPWDDTPAFLVAFEQVAKAYRWPKEEWAARLLPTLKGEAELAFSSLEAGERGDYGKVKAAILRGDALNQEKNRQCFRHFCYQEAEGPREAYNQLQEFCRRWLKVERNSKEQIFELLILEQFLTVLPPEIQSWVKKHNFESSLEAVSLAEDFFVRQWVPEVKEEQMTGSQGEEESVNSSEVEGTSSDAGQGPSPSWESEMEEDTDFSDTDWSDGGKVHENKEKSPQETSKQIQSQEVPREAASEGGPQFCNQQEFPESWNNEENQQEISPVEDGHRAVLCKKTSINANQTVIGQEIHKKQSCCSVCGKTFTHNLPLNLHKRTHKNEKLYRCSQCQEGSVSLRKCQKSDSAGKPHECLVCGKNFYDKRSLKRHQKIHAREESYRCSDCGKGFKTRISLEEHQKYHVEKKSTVPPPEVTVYICSECEESFKSALDLDAHCRIHKIQKTNVLSEHGKKICQEPDPRKHQETQAAESRFKCSDCGKSFTWSSSYSRHKKIHSGRNGANTPFLCTSAQKEKKKYPCSSCGKSFSDSWKLRRHQRTHPGEKPYQRTDCGETFMWSVSLDGHKKKIHNGKKLVPPLQKEGGAHICFECGKSFDCLAHLSQHERIHTGEKSYECVDCGESFSLSLSLERHRKKHEQKKQGYLQKAISDTPRKLHMCSECGRKFDRPSHLIRHQRIHTGEKPYQCTDCGKNFTWSMSLDVHRKKVHNWKKLVPPKKRKSCMCSKCGKSFSRASHLTQHMCIHTREKPYQCTNCGERFMWSSSLDSHKKKIHNEKKLVPSLSKVSSKKFVCSKCGKSFSKASPLARHQCIHTEEKRYQCTDCGEKFMCSTSLDVHSKTIHKGKKLVPVLQRLTGIPERVTPLSEMEKKINLAMHVIRHPERHTEEKLYKHPDCGESFTSLSSHAKDDERKKPELFLQRISTVKKEAHTCSKCGKSFEWASQLKRHQRVHTGEKPHQCPDCEESFMWSSSLDSHRKKIHNGKKSILCSDCGKSFDYASSLIRHQRLHTREKSYKCAEGGERFTLSPSPETHRKDDETEKPEGLVKKLSHTQGKKHVCSECGRSYDNARTLKIHQRIHSGEKPFQCPSCGEKFMWHSAYWRHREKIHNRKKLAPFLQRMPDNEEESHRGSRYRKSFDKQSHLLKLQGTNSREKSHMCSECGNTFNQGAHLRRHQKIHVRARLCKYKYSEQEKSFILKDSLKTDETPHCGLQQFSVQIFEDKPLQLLNNQDECKLNSVKPEVPGEV